jgi:hypothetical protein
MDSQPARRRVLLQSLTDLLAAVPYVLGFGPKTSLVILGLKPPNDRVACGMHVDLPGPPDHDSATAIAAHLLGALAAQRVTSALVIGYGPDPLITPLTDAVRKAAPPLGVQLKDVLRVQDGRYWSYLCTDSSCCPADGMPFDPAASPAAAELAKYARPVLADKDALAETLSPVTGEDSDLMWMAMRIARQMGGRIVARRGPRALDEPGIAAVQDAIRVYRQGGALSSSLKHAWLSLLLTRLPVRDDAWARMDPEHCRAHQKLWTDLTRRARPGFVAAPASLLALCAWQSGEGALANVALDRALADSPDYAMALLLRDAVCSGAPYSEVRIPLTPEQVAASYQDRDDAGPASADTLPG